MPLDLTTPEWSLAVPHLIVFVTAIVLLFADAFLPEESHYTILTGISLVGYIAAGVALFWMHDTIDSTFDGLFRADGLTLFLTLTILVAAVLTVVTSASYVERLEGRMPLGEYYVLVSFATLGALLVSSAGDMVILFIGIELTSLSTYVLAAFARRRTTSLEGALKYFLLGAFATAILLYGMAWIYGATASTDLDVIAAALEQVVEGEEFTEAALLFGMLLVIVGIAFKMAAVPFHFWTPDAYDGAPTPVTGYMSAIPKIAAFAAGIRLLVQALAPLRDDWALVVAILALITMVFGNVVAVAQRNVKRMLAYSSIAHTGYILAGFAAYNTDEGFGIADNVSDDGISAVLYYLIAYTVMNIGAFAVIAWVQHRGPGLMLDDISGLARNNLAAATAMAVFMVSLMGIPPTLGFYAKYYVIVALIRSDLLWLALAIVLMSAVSAFFYLRVVAVMFFNEPERDEAKFRAEPTGLLNVGIGGMAVATIVMGVFSSSIIELASEWSTALEVVAQTVP
ncbi:MAG: NADH-quinone oxidoreductase subunit N [Chloroflexota bacterium]|nr:NADH-quinone oxidoreductase subunit N [Chloroflexota bacterium]